MDEKLRNEPVDPGGIGEKKSLGWIIFDVEGPVIGFLTKAGELLLLSFVFTLCCVPIITIGPACTALYSTVVKNIRHSRGYPLREFFTAFKKRFKQSFIAGLIMLVWCAGLYLMYRTVGKTVSGSFARKSFIVVLTISMAIFYYLYPILSRFRIKLGNAFTMAFVMCGEHFLTSLAGILSIVGIVYLLMFVLPLVTIPFIPGIWVYSMSFLMEKALRKYMPPPTEADREKWFYE